MRRQLQTAFVVTVALILLLGVAYPLLVTGVSQVLFGKQANGSLVKAGGQVVGSRIIGQSFADGSGTAIPKYFQPRPSAAGKGYDATSSGGSQLGPSNPDLLKAVADRVAAYRQLNGLAPSAPVPVDAVTASGSGLDPDISVANAMDQVNRVASARGIDPARVRSLVRSHVDPRPWGFLGDDTVNVLDLNLALDAMR